MSLDADAKHQRRQRESFIKLAHKDINTTKRKKCMVLGQEFQRESGGEKAMSRYVEVEVSWHLHSVAAYPFMPRTSHQHGKFPPLGMIVSIVMKTRLHRGTFESDQACGAKVPWPFVSRALP